MLAWGHPRVGGDGTCGFFVVSRETLAGWVRLGGGAVVPVHSSIHVGVSHLPNDHLGTPAHCAIGKEEGRRLGVGRLYFATLKRCVTNKPRDPGYHN